MPGTWALAEPSIAKFVGKMCAAGRVVTASEQPAAVNQCVSTTKKDGEFSHMLFDVILNAIRSSTDPYRLFSSVICLEWYDGPTDGMLSVVADEYRFHLVADAAGQDYRVFQFSKLPQGTISAFMSCMRSSGVLANDSPHSEPVWVPSWWFPTDEAQQHAQRETKRLLDLAAPPELAICWDFRGRRLIAARSLGESQHAPVDWFEWLGIPWVCNTLDEGN